MRRPALPLASGWASIDTGPLMPPADLVAASSCPVTLNVAEVHQWRNGKLSRIVNYQSAMALLVEMDAIPAPAGLECRVT